MTASPEKPPRHRADGLGANPGSLGSLALRIYTQMPTRLVIFGLLILILISSSSAILYFGTTLRYPDEHHYHELALSLFKHQVYSLDGRTPTAFRPPGYPALLAVGLAFTDQLVRLKLINSIALVIAAWLLYSFLSRVGYERHGVLAAALVLFYPVLVYATTTLFPQIVAAAILLAVVLLLFTSPPGPASLVGAGILYACLILTVPSFILVLPVVGALSYWFQPRETRLRGLSIFLIAVVGVTGIWVFRNWQQLGAFVPVSTNSGINLLKGNSENSTPEAAANTDISQYSTQSTETNEIERDAFYRRSALQWISNNKLSAARLYCLKLLNHFNFRNELVIESEATRGRNWIMFFTYYALLGICSVRWLYWKTIKVEKWEIALAVLYVSFALTSAIFFTRIRFRLPMDFLLLILAGSFLGRALDRISQRLEAPSQNQ